MSTAASRPGTPRQRLMLACARRDLRGIDAALRDKANGAHVITGEDVLYAVEHLVHDDEDVRPLIRLLRLWDGRGIPDVDRLALLRAAVQDGRNNVAAALMVCRPSGSGSLREDWDTVQLASRVGNAPFVTWFVGEHTILPELDDDVLAALQAAGREQHAAVVRVWLPHVLAMRASTDATRREGARRGLTSLLRKACRHGDVDTLRVLKNAGALAHILTQDMNRGFASACRGGHLKAAQLLLSNSHVHVSVHFTATGVTDGLSEPAVDPEALEPLPEGADVPLDRHHASRDIPEYGFVMACQEGRVSVVAWLLGLQGANRIDTGGQAGVEACIRASRAGHAEVVGLLLALSGARRVDVHARYGAALAYACAGGHADVVHVLCEATEADGSPRVDVRRQHGLAMQQAVANNRVGIVQYLLALRDGTAVRVGDWNDAALLIACLEGHVNMVRVLLAAYPPDTPAGDYMGGMQAACWEGHADLLAILMQHVRPDDALASALYLRTYRVVCGQGHADVAALLVRRDLHFTDELAGAFFDGFMLAHHSGHEETAEVLSPTILALQGGPWATDNEEVVQILAAYEQALAERAMRIMRERSLTSAAPQHLDRGA